jgi:hypothetical protein
VNRLISKLKEIFGRVSGLKTQREAENKAIAEAEKIADDILEALGEAKENKE